MLHDKKLSLIKMVKWQMCFKIGYQTTEMSKCKKKKKNSISAKIAALFSSTTFLSKVLFS